MSELRSSLHPLSREELVAKIEQLRQDLAAARGLLRRVDRACAQIPEAVEGYLEPLSDVMHDVRAALAGEKNDGP